MGCWQKMVRPGVGNTQNKVRGARVLPGASPVEGLDIEVYRCQKDPSGPVHQTLLLTTRGRVTLGHLRLSSSARTSLATRSLLGTPRQALFVWFTQQLWGSPSWSPQGTAPALGSYLSIRVTSITWKPWLTHLSLSQAPWLVLHFGGSLSWPVPWNAFVLKNWSERFRHSTCFLRLEKSDLILLFRSVLRLVLPGPLPMRSSELHIWWTSDRCAFDLMCPVWLNGTYPANITVFPIQ